MKLLLTIVGLLSALLGLALSILPFGNIALIPIVIAFISGVLLIRILRKDQGNTLSAKLIFLIAILGLGMTIYRVIFDENVVEDDIEIINRDQQSEDEALKELEGIDLE
jgi:hypothetical protein